MLCFFGVFRSQATTEDKHDVKVMPQNAIIELHESTVLQAKVTDTQAHKYLCNWDITADWDTETITNAIIRGGSVVKSMNITEFDVDTSDGQCNLVVKHAKHRMGGEYHWTFYENTPAYYAYLVTIDPKPRCCNGYDGNVDTAEDAHERSFVRVSCSISMSAIDIAPPPYLYWSFANGTVYKSSHFIQETKRYEVRNGVRIKILENVIGVSIRDGVLEPLYCHAVVNGVPTNCSERALNVCHSNVASNVVQFNRSCTNLLQSHSKDRRNTEKSILEKLNDLVDITKNVSAEQVGMSTMLLDIRTRQTKMLDELIDIRIVQKETLEELKEAHAVISIIGWRLVGLYVVMTVIAVSYCYANRAWFLERVNNVRACFDCNRGL